MLDWEAEEVTQILGDLYTSKIPLGGWGGALISVPSSQNEFLVKSYHKFLQEGWAPVLVEEYMENSCPA